MPPSPRNHTYSPTYHTNHQPPSSRHHLCHPYSTTSGSCVPTPLPRVFDWRKAGLVEGDPEHRHTVILPPWSPDAAGGSCSGDQAATHKNADAEAEAVSAGPLDAKPAAKQKTPNLAFESNEHILQSSSKLPRELFDEFRSIRSNLAPVTMHEVLVAMNGFMDASSVDDMDQSCTCACCGTRVSSTSATFDLQSDNGIADLFDHATACKAGFARNQLCCVETEPIKSGDRVEVRSEDPDSDYLESYPATVTVVRREGTFDLKFDKAVAEEAPKPPPCTGGVECPLRSQYNGLHAVRVTPHHVTPPSVLRQSYSHTVETSQHKFTTGWKPTSAIMVSYALPLQADLADCCSCHHAPPPLPRRTKASGN